MYYSAIDSPMLEKLSSLLAEEIRNRYIQLSESERQPGRGVSGEKKLRGKKLFTVVSWCEKTRLECVKKKMNEKFDCVVVCACIPVS